MEHGRDNFDRRGRDRTTIEVVVSLRAPAVPVHAILLDLSRRGCRVNFPYEAPPLGTTLGLELGGAERITGEVVWSIGYELGVRFHRTLPPHLAVHWGVEDAPETRRESIAPQALDEPDPAPEPAKGWLARTFGR